MADNEHSFGSDSEPRHVIDDELIQRLLDVAGNPRFSHLVVVQLSDTAETFNDTSLPEVILALETVDRPPSKATDTSLRTTTTGLNKAAGNKDVIVDTNKLPGSGPSEDRSSGQNKNGTSEKAEPTLHSCYEQTEKTIYDVCRRCQTHLALREEMLERDIEATFGIWENLVNIENVDNVEESHQIMLGGTIVPCLGTFCGNCRKHVGIKLVAHTIRTRAGDGSYLMDLTKLHVAWGPAPVRTLR